MHYVSPLMVFLLTASLLPAAASAQRPRVVVKHKHAVTRAVPNSTHMAPPVLLADPVEIIRRSTINEVQDARRGRDFTYSEISVEKKLDRQGGLRSSESKATEVMAVEGDHLSMVVAKNGAPLGPSDAAKENDKIRQALRKYATETREQRMARLKATEKNRQDERALVEEIPRAFNFTLLPSETWHEHSCYVIQAEPKPGYQPRSKDGKYLAKFRAKIWVDQKELQWAKLDLELVDTISFGWFVARLNQGTHIQIEQASVENGVWLPKLVHVNLQARIALVQDVNYDWTRTYGDYRNASVVEEISRLGGPGNNQ